MFASKKQLTTNASTEVKRKGKTSRFITGLLKGTLDEGGNEKS
tara:strand:+ start:480 stop:608 length:129 start_codon:yes stop_codon:yes gene_type:complete